MMLKINKRKYLRKVVGIFSTGITKRGNPNTYWYILECGHFTVGNSSKVASSLDQFMLAQGLVVNKNCSGCARGEPPNIPKFTPWHAMAGLSDEILAKIVKVSNIGVR